MPVRDYEPKDRLAAMKSQAKPCSRRAVWFVADTFLPDLAAALSGGRRFWDVRKTDAVFRPPLSVLDRRAGLRLH